MICWSLVGTLALASLRLPGLPAPHQLIPPLRTRTPAGSPDPDGPPAAPPPAVRVASTVTAYLPLAGPPPLRFAAARPVAWESESPPAEELPALVAEVDDRGPAPLPPDQATALADAQLPSPADPTADPLQPPRVSTPPAVLPDDLMPRARPEDVLPFFELPGARLWADPAAPPPAPPSRATYHRTP